MGFFIFELLMCFDLLWWWCMVFFGAIVPVSAGGAGGRRGGRRRISLGERGERREGERGAKADGGDFFNMGLFSPMRVFDSRLFARLWMRHST